MKLNIKRSFELLVNDYKKRTIKGSCEWTCL